MTSRSAPVILAAGAGGTAFAVVVAWFLGRLKILYYFKAFGIGPPSLELNAGDLVFESWFVLQNLLFFALVCWVVLKTRLAWTIPVALGYALLPIAAHYAFMGGDGWTWLIRYRHTLLKLIPFLLPAIVWVAYPRYRARLKELSSPVAPAGLVLFGIIALSWGISTAKHFGSYDANLALKWPEASLVSVRLDPSVESEIGIAPGGLLYLLHAGRRQLILWDPAGFTYGVSTRFARWSFRASRCSGSRAASDSRFSPGRSISDARWRYRLQLCPYPRSKLV